MPCVAQLCGVRHLTHFSECNFALEWYIMGSLRTKQGPVCVTAVLLQKLAGGCILHVERNGSQTMAER